MGLCKALGSQGGNGGRAGMKEPAWPFPQLETNPLSD